MDAKHALKAYWKPDGEHVDKSHEALLKAWMRKQGFSNRPGALSLLLHSPLHGRARVEAVNALLSAKGKKTP